MTNFTDNHLVLQIKGMQCEDCVRRVAEAILGVEGVEDAEVDLHLARADVRLTEGGPANAETVIETVRQAGYDARQVDPVLIDE